MAAESEVFADRATVVVAAGTPILLTRDGGGSILALADRCTHRGGPLHEGEIAEGCITCPWHGSQFALAGAVRSGPATRPQLRLDVRIVAGRVQVRHADEARTLRTNPVSGTDIGTAGGGGSNE